MATNGITIRIVSLCLFESFGVFLAKGIVKGVYVWGGNNFNDMKYIQIIVIEIV